MSDDEASTVAPSGRQNSSTAAEVVKRVQEGNTPEHGTGKATAVDCVEQAAELCVIYSDEDIVVLDKPSGLRTVPGKPSESSEESSRAQTEWHCGSKRSRQEFWTEVVHTACDSLLHDNQAKEDVEFQGYLRRLTRENNVPRKRTKFGNYMAVTLGLHGKEGDSVSERLWSVVDGQLKREVGTGVDCLVTRVKTRWPNARHVHRLDQDTSGLIVMALTPEAAKEMCRQFRERVPAKTYTAVLEGRMPKDPKSGEVVAKIRPNLNDRPRQMVDEETGNMAQTLWQRLGREKDRTRVDFTPITGRTHQIRMHALCLGHPVMGDSLYGTDDGKANSDRLLLHARKLCFPHPRTGEMVEFECPPPF